MTDRALAAMADELFRLIKEASTPVPIQNVAPPQPPTVLRRKDIPSAPPTQSLKFPVPKPTHLPTNFSGSNDDSGLGAKIRLGKNMSITPSYSPGSRYAKIETSFGNGRSLTIGGGADSGDISYTGRF